MQTGTTLYLAAEVVVGNIQSQKSLQARGFGETVMQEEAVFLCAEESHHGHVALSSEREAAQCKYCVDSSRST